MKRYVPRYLKAARAVTVNGEKPKNVARRLKTTVYAIKADVKKWRTMTSFYIAMEVARTTGVFPDPGRTRCPECMQRADRHDPECLAGQVIDDLRKKNDKR